MPSPGLTLALLGGFELRGAGGAPIPVPARKVKALLAFLALQEGRPQARDRLAALLWEEAGAAQARHSLRQALASLRRLLPGEADHLTADGESVSIAPGTLAVDVLQFRRLAAAAPAAEREAAAALYRGELLEGFNPRAPAFEEWLMGERSQLREQAVRLLDGLLAHYGAEGRHERVIQTGLRLLALDPLQEPVHRALMRHYAALGRPGDALRQYRICRSALARELGVAPAEATVQLLRTLRGEAGQNLPPAPNPPAPEPPEEDAAEGALLHCHGSLLCAVLHCDPADHEARHESLRAFHSLAQQTAARYGASLVRSAPDTVALAFGLPRAQSDDAERALQAARALEQAAAPCRGRIAAGLARGTLIASRNSPAEPWLASGDAAALAERLARLAAPGEILLAPDTFRDLADRIDAEERPALGAWRFAGLRPSPAPRAFVGRAAECRQFAAALEACLDTGCGQTFLLRGEAGIGKSRLGEEFARRARECGFRVHRAAILDFGSLAERDPAALLVRSLLELPPDAAPEQCRAAIGAAITAGTLTPEHAALAADLLALPLAAEERAGLDAMDGEARSHAVAAALAGLLQGAAAAAPRLVVVEDIHWADPAALAQLARLAAVVAECPALLLLSTRVEGEPLDPGWRGAMAGAPLATLDLGPLRPGEARELALGLRPDDPEFARRCVERAGGRPLFLEQLLRAPREDDIPGSVQSIVWWQLDRLPAADRQAVQAGAVLGQRWRPEALHHLLGAPGYDPAPLLLQRLLRPAGAELEFPHALIRDAVYASLADSRKRALHQRAAGWYAGRDPGLHAEHLERAGDAGAARAYLAAAEAAAAASRYDGALEFARRGRALAREPAQRFELACLEGEVLRDAGRIEPALAVFEEARGLAGDPAGLARADIGSAGCLRVLDRYQPALELLDRAAEELGEHEGPVLRTAIHYLRGSLYFPLGRLDECLAEHERALALAQAAGLPLAQARALSGLGDAYYQRGRMVTAQGYFDRCMALCHRHGLGRIEAVNLAMRGITRLFCGDAAACAADARDAADFAAASGNRRDEVVARTVLILALILLGKVEEGLREAEYSLRLVRELGALRFEAEVLADQALALKLLGRPADLEALMTQAYARAESSGLAYCGAQVLAVWARVTADEARRRWALATGEALLAQGGVSHNDLLFYPFAIDVCLAAARWDEARRYADALEAYTAAEPLAWSAFHAARARLLAAAAGGPPAAEQASALAALEAQAAAMGLAGAAQAIAAARAGAAGAMLRT